MAISTSRGVVVPFKDRVDAGRRLAERLRHLRGEDVVVLGLPRGGVPVAAEVARALGAPLDVIVVRKLGLPSQPELAMGAVGEGGTLVVNECVVRRAHVGEAEFAEVASRERAEVQRRALRLRGTRSRLSVAGRTALVVDDGIATGSTVRAACGVARAQGARGGARRARVLARRRPRAARGGRRTRVPGDAALVPRRGAVLHRLPADLGRRGRRGAAVERRRRVISPAPGGGTTIAVIACSHAGISWLTARRPGSGAIG